MQSLRKENSLIVTPPSPRALRLLSALSAKIFTADFAKETQSLCKENPPIVTPRPPRALRLLGLTLVTSIIFWLF